MNTAFNKGAMASSRYFDRFGSWAPAFAGVTRSLVP